MEKAEGEYYAFIDSDDYVSGEMLEKMAEHAVGRKGEITVYNGVLHIPVMIEQCLFHHHHSAAAQQCRKHQVKVIAHTDFRIIISFVSVKYGFFAKLHATGHDYMRKIRGIFTDPEVKRRVGRAPLPVENKANKLLYLGIKHPNRIWLGTLRFFRQIWIFRKASCNGTWGFSGFHCRLKAPLLPFPAAPLHIPPVSTAV